MSPTSFELLGGLLQHCQLVSRKLLADAGEFYPFGAFVTPANEVQALGMLGVEHPNTQEAYSFLRGAISQMWAERRVIAYAIAANVDIPAEYKSPYSDGVRVHVEAPGYSRYIYTPYRILPHRGLRKFLVALPTVDYAQSITVDVPHDVFVRPGNGIEEPQSE